ncbi:helix-turn-helix domain-containing protein [Ktedonospora formicarum]|uniref:helix-turn-helix domain-containing protein n=1 Tax=Ktedonospora formicarum TaxID=2778364 RepID=UPI001C68ABCC
MRAWDLWQQGWKQKEIANALGVTKGAVSQWIKRGREEGAQKGCDGVLPKGRNHVLVKLTRFRRVVFPRDHCANGSWLYRHLCHTTKSIVQHRFSYVYDEPMNERYGVL